MCTWGGQSMPDLNNLSQTLFPQAWDQSLQAHNASHKCGVDPHWDVALLLQQLRQVVSVTPRLHPDPCRGGGGGKGARGFRFWGKGYRPRPGFTQIPACKAGGGAGRPSLSRPDEAVRTTGGAWSSQGGAHQPFRELETSVYSITPYSSFPLFSPGQPTHIVWYELTPLSALTRPPELTCVSKGGRRRHAKGPPPSPKHPPLSPSS